MEKATRKALAKVAEKKALLPFHGYIEGKESNLEPLIRFFPGWTLQEADGVWCAAFVYYCCREAGFDLPIRPDECRSCHLAGCIAWEEWAIGDDRIGYHKGTDTFVPEAGDIVLYDRVFNNQEHDHIGIVLRKRGNTLIVAEGNKDNISQIVERPLGEHIRAYIRIPDGYRYDRTGSAFFIGFKGKSNASAVLVRSVSPDHSLLTNSFTGLKKDIEALKADCGSVYLFGVDKNLKDSFRIEKVAEKGGSRFETCLDTDALRKQLEASGIRTCVSERPTKYLCNEAYWELLRKFGGRAVLIHIPTIRYNDESWPAKLTQILR